MKDPTYENGADESTELTILWSSSDPSSISVRTPPSPLRPKPFLTPEANYNQLPENRTDPRFWALNPDRTLPILKEGDFVLHQSAHSTSNAIIRYLAETHEVPEHYYPSDLETRSMVNSVLDWTLFVMRSAWKTIVQSLELNRPQLVDDYWGTNNGNGGSHAYKPNGIVSVMARVETLWIKKGRKYIAGSNISIADLILWSEFVYVCQGFRLYDVITEDKYPLLYSWKKRVDRRIAGSKFLQEYLDGVALLSEQNPFPPDEPKDLDLPWKDYR